MDKLCTVGYGNEPPEEFRERLKKAGIALVIDVRFRQAARLGCYRATEDPDKGMGALLAGRHDEPIESGITYIWCPELGKPKEMPMDAFCSQVLETEKGKKMLGGVCWWIDRLCKVCLLCCERHAYKDGEVNCHRVLVADAAIKLLGDDWEVVHI